jgi:hypothetical protein
MDNTTINVTDASAPITIEAVGFRVYGNKVASLAAKYEGASEVYLFPNPTSNYFTLNINTTKVQVFRWQTGSESFDASHSKVLHLSLTI